MLYPSLSIQLVAFVDSSSDRQLFYISGFGSTIQDSTGVFLTNVNRRVSILIRERIVYRGGSSVNLAAVLDDFTARFTALTVRASASVVVLTGRTSPQTAVVAASRRLVVSTSSRVSIAAIALTTRVNIATLNAFTSRSVTGQSLVFRTSVFTRVSSLLTTSVTTVGAAPLHTSVSTSVKAQGTHRAESSWFIPLHTAVSVFLELQGSKPAPGGLSLLRTARLSPLQPPTG